MLRQLFLILPAALMAGEASASARSYSNPKLDGTVIAACLSDGSSCGKPAADAFCQMEGYQESILFQRTTAAEALVLDSGAVCTSGACDAFARIKCYMPGDAARTALN
jgi:hypothetical protein